MDCEDELILTTIELVTESLRRLTLCDTVVISQPQCNFIYKPLLQTVKKRARDIYNLSFQEVHKRANTPPLKRVRETYLISIGLDTPPVKLKRVYRIKKTSCQSLFLKTRNGR